MKTIEKDSSIDCYCRKCGKKTTIFKATYVPIYGRVCQPCWSKVVKAQKKFMARQEAKSS